MPHCFVRYTGVYVLTFICVHVRMHVCVKVCWVNVCVLPVWCGLLSTPSLGRWRGCHGRVLTGPTRTHAHTHIWNTRTLTHTPGDRGQLVLKDQINEAFRTTNPPQTRQADRKGEHDRRKCVYGWRLGVGGLVSCRWMYLSFFRPAGWFSRVGHFSSPGGHEVNPTCAGEGPLTQTLNPS